jgi:hypothetical protein
MPPAVAAPATIALGRGRNEIRHQAKAQFNLLETDLMLDKAEKVSRLGVRLVDTLDMQANLFPGQLRELFEHFSVQGEAEVGIYFLLQFEEALIRPIPRPRFGHC